MKKYTKPSMTIAKFGSKEDIAANASIYAEFVTVDTSDTTHGPVSVYEIKSYGATS